MKAMLRVDGEEFIARSPAGFALMVARESRSTPTEGVLAFYETTTSSSARVKVKPAELEGSARPAGRCFSGGNPHSVRQDVPFRPLKFVSDRNRDQSSGLGPGTGVSGGLIRSSKRHGAGLVLSTEAEIKAIGIDPARPRTHAERVDALSAPRAEASQPEK
jgi:hypothetical protein